MTKPSNPFAFPGGSVIYSDNEHPPFSDGMTFRDWFAGQALIGLLCNDPHAQEHRNDLMHQEGLAAQAYSIADAMLAEREQSDGQS